MPASRNDFAGCFAADSSAQQRARLVFAGLPDDSQSSWREGAARAPQWIRRAYTAESYNSVSESGVDLAGAVFDAGDLRRRGSWPQTSRRFASFAGSVLLSGKVPFFAGGDHAVSVPVIEALACLKTPVHVIQFDAHPDLYPEYEGSRTSHACVAARLLEMRHVASLTQFGIRTLNAVQERTASAHSGRIRMFPARELEGSLPRLDFIPAGSLVHLDVDMDGFDPAFAPGVSHPVPGGLAPRQVLNFIQRMPWRLASMSVVEVNPEYDENYRTAILAARLLHEGMAFAAALPARST